MPSMVGCVYVGLAVLVSQRCPVLALLQLPARRRPYQTKDVPALRSFDAVAESAAERESLQMEARLWDGLDMPLEFLLDRYQASLTTVERNVHIFGLQDTGTNLLMSMLLKNFDQRLRFFDWAYAPNATGKYGHGLWKHVNLNAKFQAEPHEFDTLKQNKVVPIMMVREPLSWLQSIRKAPYELQWCVFGSEWPKNDWLTRACTHPYPAGFHSSCPETAYSSLEEIWNQWTEAYEQVAEHMEEGIIIRYEDLVANPELELTRLAKRLGISPPAEFEIMATSAKTHGESIGRNEALDKIQSKTYLDEFFVFQRAQACERLSNKRMRNHDYHDCDGFGGPGAELVDETGILNQTNMQKTLWAGMDIPQDKVFTQGKTVKEMVGDLEGVEQAPLDAPNERNIHVLGLQHSGTSLLSAMLVASFGSRLRMYEQSSEAQQGDLFAQGIWKHADLESLYTYQPQELSMLSSNEVYAIAVVRDPMSWLEAVIKQPMEFRRCTQGSTSQKDNWITRSCILDAPGGAASALKKMSYKNMGSVWNHWMQSYGKATKFGFKGVLLIRYEDLLVDPQGEMNRVAQFLGVNPPAVNAAQHIAKDAGEERQRSVDFMRDREYMDFFTFMQDKVCKTLDRSIMKKHNYTECPAFRHSRKGKWRPSGLPSISQFDFLTDSLIRVDEVSGAEADSSPPVLDLQWSG